MRLGSVRARLMVWNVAIVAILTVSLGALVSWRTRSELVAQIDRDLLDRAERHMGLPGRGPGQVPGPPPMGDGPGGPMMRRTPDVGPGGEIRPRGPRGPGFQAFDPNVVFVAQGAFRPRVFDLRGRSISQFTQDEPWDPKALEAARRDRPPILSNANWQGEEHRVLTTRLPWNEGEMAVQYAVPLAATRQAIAGINQILLAMLPLALFVAGLGGYYLTERALRPVGRIAALAERISGENLAERLPVHGNDEFAQLARTINATLDRLERAFRELSEAMERQRRFTADASHELKTPLTAIKARTSLALHTERGAADYRASLEAIDRSATRMGELIDDLLQLARADSGAIGDMEEVDLSALVREASEVAVPLKSAPIAVKLDPRASSVRGHRGSLLRLLANLLGNAARHTPREGHIAVRTRSEPGFVVIEVEDSGEGIAPEHLPHLGERFYRVDSARARSEGGVGLGLAICRAIAEAHGGAIAFASELGRGTTVTVRLPLLDAQPIASTS